MGFYIRQSVRTGKGRSVGYTVSGKNAIWYLCFSAIWGFFAMIFKAMWFCFFWIFKLTCLLLKYTWIGCVWCAKKIYFYVKLGVNKLILIIKEKRMTNED